MTGPFGERSLQFTYGGDGQITQITSMPGGEVYRYEYDSRLLTAVVYPDGNDDPPVPTSYDDNPSRQYAYDESAYITVARPSTPTMPPAIRRPNLTRAAS